MSLERSRRERFGSQPVPLTWELPALLVATTLACVVMTPLVVQGLTCALLTGRFAWPSGEVATALDGLVRGDFGAGLPTRVAQGLPPDAAMWATTLAAEILVLGSILLFGKWLRDLAGMGPHRGLATPGQAAEALGLKTLRQKTSVVRPDLQRQRHQMVWGLKDRFFRRSPK